LRLKLRRRRRREMKKWRRGSRAIPHGLKEAVLACAFSRLALTLANRAYFC
jgi:hypothetical protein